MIIIVSILMPYKIIKTGSGYKVAKKHGGKTFSKKPLPKKRALAQLRAIEVNSHESVKTGLNLIALIEQVIKEDISDVNGSGSETAPGRLDVATQASDFLRFKGKEGFPSVGNKPLEIRIKRTDSDQVSNALKNAGIPFSVTDDGVSNTYFIFKSAEQHRAAQQVLHICEDRDDANEGGPEDDETWERDPVNITNEPVGTTAPKQDLLRSPGGTANI